MPKAYCSLLSRQNCPFRSEMVSLCPKSDLQETDWWSRHPRPHFNVSDFYIKSQTTHHTTRLAPSNFVRKLVYILAFLDKILTILLTWYKYHHLAKSDKIKLLWVYVELSSECLRMHHLKSKLSKFSGGGPPDPPITIAIQIVLQTCKMCPSKLL